MIDLNVILDVLENREPWVLAHFKHAPVSALTPEAFVRRYSAGKKAIGLWK